MTIDRLSSQDRGAVPRFVRRAMLVGAVITVTMLGHLRSQASEVRQAPAVDRRAESVAHATLDRDDATRLRPTVASDAGDATSDEELRLVPAIYAWDPDVRFVYFRHVSKWM